MPCESKSGQIYGQKWTNLRSKVDKFTVKGGQIYGQVQKLFLTGGIG
ncbi:MAG: hypothetical protein ACRCSC_05140 [Lactococcus garvieae]